MSKIRVDEIVDISDGGSPDLPHGATGADPTERNQVATKSYVDGSLTGTFSNSVSTTPPENPAIGSFWVDNSNSLNVLKCWNGSVWEEFSGMLGGISYLMGIEDPTVLKPAYKSGYPSIPYIPSTSEITNIHYGGGDMATSAINVGAYHQDIAYGDGKFVVVCRKGGYNQAEQRVQWSSDGINWNATDHAEENWWWGVTYGDGKFVAVSGSTNSSPFTNVGTNRVMWSTDGISWNSALASHNADWRKIAYGEPNGQPTFVAIAYSGDGVNDQKAMYSHDAINWYMTPTARDVNSWIDIVYGDGKFVAIAGSGAGNAMYSTDGINWTLGAEGLPSISFVSAAYGEPNGKPTFVAIGSGTNAYYSHDAINWDVAVVPKSAEWKHVTYGEPNGQPTYVAVAKDSDEAGAGYTMYSHDGITWVNRPGASNPANLAIVHQWEGPIGYGDGKFVKFASWAMSTSATKIVGYSYDGINWQTPHLTFTFADDKVRMLDNGDPIPGETLGTIFEGGETLYDFASYGGTAAASGEYAPTSGTDATNVFTIFDPYQDGPWTVGMKLRSTRTVSITYEPAWPIWDTATTSIPTVSEGAITKWGRVEWNVAEDSAFTTNLQESIVDIVEGAPQNMPSDIIIEANKEYYLRVRYSSLEPAVSFSNWSEEIVFKTETVAFPDPSASPWTDPSTGTIYTYSYSDGVWSGTQP